MRDEKDLEAYVNQLEVEGKAKEPRATERQVREIRRLAQLNARYIVGNRELNDDEILQAIDQADVLDGWEVPDSLEELTIAEASDVIEWLMEL